MADIWDALTNPQTQATPAMIASLRNQSLMGQLGMITGDKVMGQLGQNMYQQAMGSADQLGKNALTEQERQTQQNWRDVQERHYLAEQGQQQDTLEETRRAHDQENKYRMGMLGLGEDGKPLYGGGDGTGADGKPLSDFETHVRNILNYDEAPRTTYGNRNPQNSAIMAEVERRAAQNGEVYDSTFYNNKNKTMQAFGGTGKQGQTLRSADVLVHHLGVLDDAVNNLNNGQVVPWNAAKQYIQTNLGLSTAPKDYTAVNSLVSDELVKFVLANGVGGVTDREGAQHWVDQQISKNGQKSVVASLKQLAVGQIQGLKQEFTANTRITDPNDFRSFEHKFSPRTVQEMQLDMPNDYADKLEQMKLGAKPTPARVQPARPPTPSALPAATGAAQHAPGGWSFEPVPK